MAARCFKTHRQCVILLKIVHEKYYLNHLKTNQNYYRMLNFTKLTASAVLMLSTVFGASAVSHLKLIGAATPGGWEIVDGVLLPPDPDNENVFSCVAYLKADEEFKFTANNDWSNDKNEFRNASSDPYDITKLQQGGSDQKFKVSESANYRLVLNTADLTISIAKADYQAEPIRFNALFMIGNATPGGWTILDGTPLNWGGESDPFKFTWSGELNAGEFKINSNKYSDIWGGPWFFVGLGENGELDYNKIVADGTGDRKWQIAEAGNYNIDVDLLKGSIAITKAPVVGVDEISYDNDATPVYYNLQGIVVPNPSNGIFIKKVGNKVSKVAL